MFRYFFSILIFNFMFLTISLHAENSFSQVYCEPELKKCWNALQQSSEVKQLVSKIQKEGSISIKANRHSLAQQFGAFWDLDRRIICVDVAPNRSEGEIMGSILFELHNALATSKLNHLDKMAMEGKIDKENYVRGVEFVEYQNSLSASKISEEGIRKGIFPSSAYLPTYRNFEEHYYYQKQGGHSAWIAQNFDYIRGY